MNKLIITFLLISLSLCLPKGISMLNMTTNQITLRFIRQFCQYCDDR